MYRQHYGLHRRPFTVEPDPGCLYLSAGYRAAAAILQHSVAERQGFVVIVGDAGTGKTTLLRGMMGQLKDNCVAAFVANPLPRFGSILGRVLLAFGIEASDAEPLQMIDQFHLLVSELARAGKRALIVIDEGQALGAEQLEELRMLSNAGESNYMPQVVLAGQHGLRDTLRRPELTQLAQRVVGECEIRPLDCEETREYISFRLNAAGSDGREIFDQAACAALFEFSHGIPRLINILCEDALTYGVLATRDSIDASMVVDLARDRQRAGILPVGSSRPVVATGSPDAPSILSRAVAL